MIFGFMSYIQNNILEVFLHLNFRTNTCPAFNCYGFIKSRILLKFSYSVTHVIRMQMQAAECHPLDFKLFITMLWRFVKRNNRQLHMQLRKFIVL